MKRMAMSGKGFGAGTGRSGHALEWPTLVVIAACYGAWFGLGLLYARAPLAAVVLMALPIALHSSLQHEALHGHPTRWALVNEALVSMPLGLFVSFRRYKRLHLRHHADERLTDPYDDPESYYLALRDWERLPRPLKTLLRWNNTLVARVLIGPAITLVGFTAAELKGSAALRDVRRAWLLHAAVLVPALAIVTLVFRMPIWDYLTSAYLGMSLLAIRSFCEHQWSEHADRRSVIVERSILGPLFLNNNLHLVHHKHPTAPWYDLPRLYRARRLEWRRMNDGYVFKGYVEVLRRFGLRAKEPVAHPSVAGADQA
jgi:fatty acid desaturase